MDIAQSYGKSRIMPNKRTILLEAAMVVGVLATGIAAAGVAHAQSQSAPAQASNIKIESKILVERIEKDTDGKDIVKTFSPSQVKVVPGDRLVFVNAYRNTASTSFSGFVVNNPIHSAVAFSGVEEDWAVVSVDGGKTFGQLDSLTVGETIEEDGVEQMTQRPAKPADVTHVRWAFKNPIAAGASGEVRFRGTVK